MKKTPKYKKGDKVYADLLGRGVIKDSYWVKKEFLYHIKQGGFLLGNIPESWVYPLQSKHTHQSQ